MPYCYRDYEILDNGPLRFTLSLTFNPARINGQTVTEHRVMQLDKGRHLNKITVWYDGLRRPAEVAGGFVVHDKQYTLTIGSRQGTFPGMPKSRTFIAVCGDKRVEVTYEGTEISLIL